MRRRQGFEPIDLARIALKRIEHRFTRINHPWTSGQVERHLDDFVSAYNFGRCQKTLKGLTPYELICKRWTSEPGRFRLDPIHQMPGLNT